MRDEETFMTAIHAAETGHLVFGTIHASSAPTTIGRIGTCFLKNCTWRRNAMAFNMKGIVAPKLLRSIKPGVGRVPTCEIMTFYSDDPKTGSGRERREARRCHSNRCGREGMQDFTMSLKQLIDDELIDRPTAFEVAPNPDALKMALKGINVSQPGII